MKKLYFVLFAFVALLASCKKSDTVNNPLPGSPAPGFGTSNAAFGGTNWQLSQGIILKDSIRDASWWTDVHGGQPVLMGNYGGLPGGSFTVCLYLENTTSQTITIQFPEEILLLSNTIKTQNGLILGLQTITIPAHTEKVIIAGAFCINLTRHLPDLNTDDGNLQGFSFGPTTVPAGIKEISTIMKAKNISYQSLMTPGGIPDATKLAAMSIVQAAVWEVTDEGGLTQETRTALQNLHF